MNNFAQNGAQQAAQQAADQLEQVTSAVAKACSDCTDVARETVKVALRSTNVLSQGYEEVLQSYNALMQNFLSQSSNAVRQSMGARSVRDLVEMQSSLFKSGFDTMMAEMNKISQISARTCQQAAEPVTDHVNSTLSKITSKAKAAA